MPMFTRIQFKPGLRKKALFFSIVLTLTPLVFSSSSMISITQSELKSAVNDTMIHTARSLAAEIDNIFIHAWQAPLQLLADAVDNENLGPDEKIALLQSASHSMDDFAVLQLSVAGFPPALFVQQEIQQKLQAAGQSATEALPAGLSMRQTGDSGLYVDETLHYLADADIWLMDLYLPLKNTLAGQKTMLAARVNLSYPAELVHGQSFNQTGQVRLINRQGQALFEASAADLRGEKIVETAAGLLQSGASAISAMPFAAADGTKMLGAYAVLNTRPWAAVVTMTAQNAYMAIDKMLYSLLIWLFIGLIAAIVVAVWFSRHLTKPILEIAGVVRQVGEGNLSRRVRSFRGHDEITALGQSINTMIQGLLEHFNLQKFVSGGTLAAVKQAGGEGVKLGGERRFATVFFSDIRGFTAFSEKVTPEIVISMLNMYLSAQAKIVKKYHGDIDKFVGDELVAVFQGKDMVRNAILCACEIQRMIRQLNREQSAWDIKVGIGINCGDMVMGAMGSDERMDYTILGDNVNLGARLCSHAGPQITLVSENAREELKNSGYLPGLQEQNIFLQAQTPIQVKGKTEPVIVYQTVCHDPLNPPPPQQNQ